MSTNKLSEGIRQKDKARIRTAIPRNGGVVVHVTGPPMVGKAITTLLALKDLQRNNNATIPQPHRNPTPPTPQPHQTTISNTTPSADHQNTNNNTHQQQNLSQSQSPPPPPPTTTTATTIVVKEIPCSDVESTQGALRPILHLLGLNDDVLDTDSSAEPPSEQEVVWGRIRNGLEAAAGLNSLLDIHYIFVFTKCQKIYRNGEGHEFVKALHKLSRLKGTKVTCVFTGYIRSHYEQRTLNPSQVNAHCEKDCHGVTEIELDFLTDPADVLTLLMDCLPDYCDHDEYVEVCQRLCPLPGVIRAMAQELEQQEDFRFFQRQEDVALLLQDQVFLSRLFQEQSSEVEGWLESGEMDTIRHFCGGIGHTFTEDHLKETIDDPDFDTSHLMQKFVLRSVSFKLSDSEIQETDNDPSPSHRNESTANSNDDNEDDDNDDEDKEDQRHVTPKEEDSSLPPPRDKDSPLADHRGGLTARLSVHPLVIFYCRERERLAVSQGKMAVRRHLQDHSCNRFTSFMGRLLSHVERGLRGWGQGLGHVIAEQHNFRHVVEMALHCGGDTYPNFVQLAVAAESPILRLLTPESRPFFESLFTAACKFGTLSERAVVQGYWGHSIALGEGTWHSEAMEEMKSAISALRQFPVSYHLVWTMTHLAILHSRKGAMLVAVRILKEAMRLAEQIDPNALGAKLSVSDARIAELKLKIRIFLVAPLTSLDRIPEASRMLSETLEQINAPAYRRHPDLPVLLNTKGLFEQRVNNDRKTAIIYYSNSLAERKYLEELKPNILIIPLTNLSSALQGEQRTGEALKCLEYALTLCTRTGWYKFQTAYTLINMVGIKIKRQLIPEAYLNAIDADRILQRCSKDHELVLQTNIFLGHLKARLYEHPGQPQEFRIRQDYRGREERDYFQFVVEWMRDMRGDRSGDGHYWVLCALGHLVLLCRTRDHAFLRYRKEFLEYFEACMCLPHGEIQSRSLFLRMEPVYTYLRENSEATDTMSAETFAQEFCTACLDCRDGDEHMWLALS